MSWYASLRVPDPLSNWGLFLADMRNCLLFASLCLSMGSMTMFVLGFAALLLTPDKWGFSSVLLAITVLGFVGMTVISVLHGVAFAFQTASRGVE